MTTIENKDRAELLTQASKILRPLGKLSPDLAQAAIEMQTVLDDPNADADDKVLAENTLLDILQPIYDGGLLGVAMDEYDRSMPKADLCAEVDLDAQEASFAKKLGQAMTTRSLTQMQLAEKAGVSQPAISNMLARECRPQRRTVVKLAEALGMAPEELWPFKD